MLLKQGLGTGRAIRLVWREFRLQIILRVESSCSRFSYMKYIIASSVDHEMKSIETIVLEEDLRYLA